MLKKRALWLTVFLSLTVISITVQISSQGFSFVSFRDCFSNANIFLLAAAFCSMLGVICFEGASLCLICRRLGHARPFRHGLVFCAADLFFSAITPSSSGGQPVSAYCMYTDDIPMEVASVAVLLNLILYEISMFLVAVVCVLLRPALLLTFSAGTLVFVLIGAAFQSGLLVLLILVLLRPALVHAMGNWGISLLAKLRLLHRVEDKRERLSRWIERYSRCSETVRGNGKMLLKALTLNLGQRLCMLLVPMLVYLALGGAWINALNVFIGQSYVYVGSNVIPLPGAVGAADWLFVSICGEFFSDPVSFNLLSRGISFYCNVAICGILTWVWLLRHKKSGQGG